MFLAKENNREIASKENLAYIKFCNNEQYINTKALEMDPVVQSIFRFLVYTAEKTKYFMVVTDLQGVKTRNGVIVNDMRGPKRAAGAGKIVYRLTDPAICCTDVQRFGGGTSHSGV